MYPAKTVLLVLAALLLAGAIVSINRSAEDQDRVSRLQRKHRTLSAAADAENAVSGDRDLFRRLSDSTYATKRRGGSIWTVQSPQASPGVMIQLPFDPTTGVTPRPEDRQIKDSNPGFMGASACAECHQEKHRAFVSTAHHKTSALVTAELTRRLGDARHDTMLSPWSDLFFKVRRDDQQCYQQVNLSDWKLRIPMDVVVGSSKAGQSFLYWHGSAIFQSYLSHLTVSDSWIPSPGYNQRHVSYARPIRTSCLECHMTYIEKLGHPNRYAHNSAIWGISCERCHGPGRQHVQHHRRYPKHKVSKYITHPADLPRDRQLDICGQCHSGPFKLVTSAFTFRPGDELDRFHKHPESTSDSPGGIHTSNQLVRLRKSKCFQYTEITCTTCHDPHSYQRGDAVSFTQRCLSCHASQDCGMSRQLGDRVADNCISCHMPTSINQDMSDLAGTKMQSLTVDHFIRISKKATDEHLARIRPAKQP